MCAPKAPAAPDPKETSAASTGTNVATAIANAYMNNYNQVTPDGSLSFETTGYEDFTDPYTGQTYKIPTRTATQTLSETNQAIKNQTDAATLGLAGTANQLASNAQAGLASPFEFNNSDAEQWAYDLASPRILAQQGQNEAALRTTLANKGIREGSAAWNNEMNRLTQGNSDQLNQLALSGRQQAYNEARDQYTLPLNTLTAMLSGSQVSQPNYVNPNASPIPTTDNAGIINQDYQNRLGAYQQQMSQWNGVMGGLMGLGGRLIGLSDERAKKDKKKVGKIDGMGLYEFRYKGEPSSQPKHVGLMAQEVERKKPGAVHTGRDGLKRVDYGKALGLMGA